MSWYKPNSVEDFRAALQHCLDNGRMLMLDPDTRLEFSTPLGFTPRGGWAFPSGLSAYGAQFTWKSDGSYDKTMFRFETEAGQESRNLTIRGLSILGDATQGSAPPAGKLVELIGRGGSALRGFLVEDFNWEHGCTALHLEGEVFEGYVVRPRGSWARDFGIVCRHGYEVPGVMSNIYIQQPNITRMPARLGSAIGILCDWCSSVMVTDGNFISLDGPAIKATNGIKRLQACDFENAGNTLGCAIEIDHTDYWSQVWACEGSNTQGDMKYLLYHGGDPDKLDVGGSRMYDGEVTPEGMVWRGTRQGTVMAPPGYKPCVVEGRKHHGR